VIETLIAEPSAVKAADPPGTYTGVPVLDFVRPTQLVDTMVDTGASKGDLAIGHILVRGMLGGALLAYPTAMAFLGIAQGMIPILAGALFPMGFIIINMLQVDLATGYFCYVPLAWCFKRISFVKMVRAICWVYVANLIGSLVVVFLLWAAITTTGRTPDATGISAVAMKIGLAKSVHYEQFGLWGALTAFDKGMLCNWMVTLGVVLPMASRSAIGKVLGTYIPIFMFFALGYEHMVVNMFIIPAAMLFGAPITQGDFWIGNELPVTLGNFCGGFLFTGAALGWIYLTRRAPA